MTPRTGRKLRTSGMSLVEGASRCQARGDGGASFGASPEQPAKKSPRRAAPTAMGESLGEYILAAGYSIYRAAYQGARAVTRKIPIHELVRSGSSIGAAS